MSAEVGFARTLGVLRRSQNQAAVDLLFSAARSGRAEIRTQAVAALTTRRNRQVQLRLIEEFPDLSADAQRVFHTLPPHSPLRAALPVALTGDNLRLCRRACLTALACLDYDSLPVMVELALDPDHPHAMGLASTALQLAKRLHSESLDFDAGKPTSCGDPAFARRGAVHSLDKAVESFAQHRRVELVEAFLLLAPHDHPTLLSTLRTAGHPGRGSLLTVLRSSPSEGAFGVLLAMLHDTTAPHDILETLADRTDRGFVSRLLRSMNDPVSLRVVENCGRLKEFRWAAADQTALVIAGTGLQQAAAVRLTAATKTPRAELVRLCRAVLAQGQPAGRRAACKQLDAVPAHLAIPVLKELLADEDPVVLAAAASQLRKHDYPDALPTLVELLAHPAEEVRTASQKSLYELRFSGYRDAYPRLSPRAREVAGALVAKADPHWADALQAELLAPGVKRRMLALEFVEMMGVEQQLATALVQRLEDHDAGVRAEAARLLGRTESRDAQAALIKVAADPHATVRAAAEKSLHEFKSLETAAKLVDHLAAEFPL